MIETLSAASLYSAIFCRRLMSLIGISLLTVGHTAMALQVTPLWTCGSRSSSSSSSSSSSTTCTLSKPILNAQRSQIHRRPVTTRQRPSLTPQLTKTPQSRELLTTSAASTFYDLKEPVEDDSENVKRHCTPNFNRRFNPSHLLNMSMESRTASARSSSDTAIARRQPPRRPIYWSSMLAPFLSVPSLSMTWTRNWEWDMLRGTRTRHTFDLQIVPPTWRDIRSTMVLLGSVWLTWTLLQALRHTLAARRRQRLDPTSEWERYASSPGARGRAVLSLVVVSLVPIWMQLGLFQLLARIKGRNHDNGVTQRRCDALQTKAGQVVAEGLLRLGPLYIKIGQILSSARRSSSNNSNGKNGQNAKDTSESNSTPDTVLPRQWQPALERLQDQVPAQSGAKAQNLAYATWPGGKESFDTIFCDVNWTPLAAASLGQVHVAKLRDSGDTVALKLQRPKLREIYDQDFALLTKIAAIVDKRFGSSAGSAGGIQQSWTEIFGNARAIMYREIDYRAEARHGMRFAQDFGLGRGGQAASSTSTSSNNTVALARDGKPLPSAASWLRTPYVYANLSTEQVLVMEYVPGIKVTATDKLDAANVTAADKEYLADCLGRSYLRQFCCNKFFSTDPHAGNLAVEVKSTTATNPADRVRLVYYDFGQVAELQQNQADGILDMIESIVDMDVDRSVESFQEMGVLKENADLAAVRAKVADNYRTGKVKANRKRLKQRGYQLRDSLNDGSNSTESAVLETAAMNAPKVSDAQVMQYFTLPAEYAFVGRALTQMDGVGKTLDPDFDFISASAPYIVEIKGAGRYLQDEALKWIANVCNQLKSVIRPSKDSAS